jgi:hypothetical protein
VTEPHERLCLNPLTVAPYCYASKKSNESIMQGSDKIVG